MFIIIIIIIIGGCCYARNVFNILPEVKRVIII